MNKEFGIVTFFCLMLFIVGCQVANVDSDNEIIPGVDMTIENPLDLRKIYIARPSVIQRPTTAFLPRTYSAQLEIIEEVNKILEEKINTVIDIEYIPYEYRDEEILTKLYANDNIDIIDYPSKIPEPYIKDLNIADLTDILPVYYPELFEDGIDLSNTYNNGRIYDFPTIIARAFRDRLCLIIDREFYESAGSPSVKTIEDIISLYEFGVEHKNKEGLSFLDANVNRYFLCPFPFILELYVQRNGYTLLSYSDFYAEKDGDIIDLLETDIIEDCYNSLAYLNSKNAISSNRVDRVNWLPIPTNKFPGLSMALESFNTLSFYSMGEPYEFNRLYTSMFIGDYEPYSFKELNSRRLTICNNGNADRSVIALRLLYEDRELNRLLTYGVEGKHYRFVDGHIEDLWNEAGSVKNWWLSIINNQHFVSMIYSPEGSEQYVQNLYNSPKQIFPGVDNSKLNYTSIIKNNKEMYEIISQRSEIYWTLFTYEQVTSKGITYNDIIYNLDKEEQRTLYDFIKEYIDRLKNK